MSWTETHRRWRALQEIEALANATELDELPWTPEYAAIFGDRDHLAAALRYRWEHTRRAQLDTHLAEDVLEEQWSRLRARHAGVVRLLERYDRTRSTDEANRIPA
jgi:hypothetical protein